jgi:hypothetical protein
LDPKYNEKVYIYSSDDNAGPLKGLINLFIQAISKAGTIMVQKDNIFGLSSGFIRSLLFSEAPKARREYFG